MIGPRKMAQVALTVRDLEAAKSFYRDVLGLRHLFDAPPGLSFFQCGETRLMLSEGGEDESIVLYYGVDDVPAACEALGRNGAEPIEAPRRIAQVEGRDVWLAFCRDPDGRPVGLISN